MKGLKKIHNSVKFANAVFISAIFYSILVAILSIYKTYQPYAVFNYSTFTFISIGLAIFFSLGLILNNNQKVNFSLFTFTIFITIYLFEVFLELYPQHQKSIKINSKLSTDNRKIMDVVNDFNKVGNKSYPYIGPISFTNSNGLKSNNGRIYPLGGIPNVTTVFCNESGYWSIFKSDEHGFNNPKGLYKRNNIEIFLIGDSMTDGACVNNFENIPGVIRKLGYSALNVGRGGNGPLIELASLKEYAEPLRPQIVLWQFYDNDFRELQRELNSPILRKYIEKDSFDQNLINRSEEIETSLINYFHQSLNQLKDAEAKTEKTLIKRIIYIFKLPNLRTRLNLTPKPNTNVLKTIISKAKQIVSKWGGSLYFVYIPSNFEIRDQKNSSRNIVLNTINELNIPIIDIKEEVIDLHLDPLSLFPFKNSQVHYNSIGYRLMAEVIINRLNSDGKIDLN